MYIFVCCMLLIVYYINFFPALLSSSYFWSVTNVRGMLHSWAFVMAGNGPWYPPRPNRFVYIATRAGFSYKVSARCVALSANQRPQLSGAHFVCHTYPLQIAIWRAASNYLFSNSETTPVKYAHSGVRHRNNFPPALPFFRVRSIPILYQSSSGH